MPDDSHSCLDLRSNLHHCTSDQSIHHNDGGARNSSNLDGNPPLTNVVATWVHNGTVQSSKNVTPLLRQQSWSCNWPAEELQQPIKWLQKTRVVKLRNLGFKSTQTLQRSVSVYRIVQDGKP